MTNVLKNYIDSKINMLKKIDLHINDNDDSITVREKDMYFGQLIAYENILQKLKEV